MNGTVIYERSRLDDLDLVKRRLIFSECLSKSVFDKLGKIS